MPHSSPPGSRVALIAASRAPARSTAELPISIDVLATLAAVIALSTTTTAAAVGLPVAVRLG